VGRGQNGRERAIFGGSRATPGVDAGTARGGSPARHDARSRAAGMASTGISRAWWSARRAVGGHAAIDSAGEEEEEERRGASALRRKAI
jgi:hypothetical protein